MKVLALIIMLFSSSLSTFSQSNNDELKFGRRANTSNPAVFVDYVCQDKRTVYLRMYNNTAWVIGVTADKLSYYTKKTVKLLNGKEFYSMPNDKEVPIQYRVEKFALPWENVNVPKLAQPDSSSLNWIAAKDSVLFSVPIDYLRDDLQVIVRFNYEWEMTEHGSFNTDPEHRVSFRGIDFSSNKKLACEK